MAFQEVSKARIFKGKYEAKIKFPERWGMGEGQTKIKPSVGGVFLWTISFKHCPQFSFIRTYNVH